MCAAGMPAILTREPGGTPLGEVLREIIRKPALARRFSGVLRDETLWTSITPAAELLLFAADRAQHVDALIRPALASGTSVICDRFAESTLAYQGYGRGLPPDELAQAIALATRGLRPDVILLLDVPVDVGLARKQGEAGRDQIGQETRQFHQRVRDGYLELAAQEPARWLVLDATRPPDELAAEAWERVARMVRATDTRQ